MSLRFFRPPSSRFNRVLLAALSSLAVAGAVGACSNEDDDSEAASADYAVAVTALNETGSGEPIGLRCDATLAVQVAISTSDPQLPFVLKPAYACGTSTRCGYVHIEALDADDQLLASVDTATLAGVLRLPSADVAPARIRAQLMSGVDREPLANPSGDEASATLEPTFVPASTTCEVQGAGGEGGAPGAAGAAQGGTGGAGQGGSPSGGTGAAAEGGGPSAGGEGGSVAAAGATGVAQGGAGAGGAPATP